MGAFKRRPIFLIISAIILAITTNLMGQESINGVNKFAVVNTRYGLVFRKGPGIHHEKLFTLSANSLVKIISQQDKAVTIDGRKGKWTKVGRYSLRGWVFGAYLTPVSQLKVAYINATNDTNAHKEPIYSSEKLFEIPYRKKVTIPRPVNYLVDRSDPNNIYITVNRIA